MDKYLNTAVSAAKEAGIIFKKYFGKPKKVSLKNGDPRNLVTEIDRALEKLIKAKLHQAFPKHDIIGEETGLSRFHNKNSFQWFVDPVDGTTNYIQGLPFCCISIALWDEKGPLVGVVYNPILNLLFTASRGQGAYLNNKKIKVSKETRPIHAYGGFGWGRDREKAAKNFPVLIKFMNKIRTIGSSTLELCFVALGVYDFHIQTHFSIWDFAAAVLVITEAGGKVTDWKGNPVSKQTVNIVACNPKLHQKLLQKTKKLSI